MPDDKSTCEVPNCGQCGAPETVGVGGLFVAYRVTLCWNHWLAIASRGCLLRTLRDRSAMDYFVSKVREPMPSVTEVEDG